MVGLGGTLRGTLQGIAHLPSDLSPQYLDQCFWL